MRSRHGEEPTARKTRSTRSATNANAESVFASVPIDVVRHIALRHLEPPSLLAISATAPDLRAVAVEAARDRCDAIGRVRTETRCGKPIADWPSTLANMAMHRVRPACVAADYRCGGYWRPTLVPLPAGHVLIISPSEEIYETASLRRVSAAFASTQSAYTVGAALPCGQIVLSTARGVLGRFRLDVADGRLRPTEARFPRKDDAIAKVSILLALSDDRVVLGDECTGELRVWDMAEAVATEAGEHAHPGLAAAAAATRCRELFASGSMDGSVCVWVPPPTQQQRSEGASPALGRWSPVRAAGVHGLGVNCMSWMPCDRRRLVTGGVEGGLKVSALSDGEDHLLVVCTLQRDDFLGAPRAMSAVMALREDRVVSVEASGCMRVWDQVRAEEEGKWSYHCLAEHMRESFGGAPTHKPRVAIVALSDGRIATATKDSIRVWA